MTTIGAGLGLGAATSTVVAIAEVTITGGSTINLREAIGVGVAVCGIVWWLGKKFQKIDDRLERIETTIKDK